jgi:predicted DNA-binding transcriptional regulator AlpA
MDELIDIREVCRMIGGNKPVDPSTVYRGIKEGRYSKPFKIAKQAVRWKRSEIEADIDRMILERDNAA